VVLHSIHFEISKLSVGNKKFSNCNDDIENNGKEEFSLEHNRSAKDEELVDESGAKGRIEGFSVVSRSYVEVEDSNSEEFNESRESVGNFVELINDAFDCDLVITSIL